MVRGSHASTSKKLIGSIPCPQFGNGPEMREAKTDCSTVSCFMQLSLISVGKKGLHDTGHFLKTVVFRGCGQMSGMWLLLVLNMFAAENATVLGQIQTKK